MTTQDKTAAIRRATACAAELERSGVRIARLSRAIQIDLNGGDLVSAGVTFGILAVTMEGMERVLDPLVDAVSDIIGADGGAE